MTDPNAVNSTVPMGKALPRFYGVGGFGGGGGGSSSSSSSNVTNYSGAGSPEGVVAAPVGAIYTNISSGGLWNKVTGVLATGWNELIQ